ncbi:hypothetical protein JCM11491_004714 [Sporobolomyces phaffii]
MRTPQRTAGAVLASTLPFISGIPLSAARPPTTLARSLALPVIVLYGTASNFVAAANAPAGGAGVGNSSSTACGWASSCPQSSPCCSEFGYCSS